MEPDIHCGTGKSPKSVYLASERPRTGWPFHPVEQNNLQGEGSRISGIKHGFEIASTADPVDRFELSK